MSSTEFCCRCFFHTRGAGVGRRIASPGLLDSAIVPEGGPLPVSLPRIRHTGRPLSATQRLRRCRSKGPRSKAGNDRRTRRAGARIGSREESDAANNPILITESEGLSPEVGSCILPSVSDGGIFVTLMTSSRRRTGLQPCSRPYGISWHEISLTNP